MRAIILVALLISNIVSANTIQVELTGTVDHLDGRLIRKLGANNVSSFININDSFTFKFLFDESFSTNISGTKTYQNAISSFSGTVQNYNFSGATGSISLTNDARGRRGPPTDAFGVSFNSTDFTNTDGFAVVDSNNRSITLSALGDSSTSSFPLSLVSMGTGSVLNSTVFNNLDLDKNNISMAFSEPSLKSINIDFSGGFNVGAVISNVTITNITTVPLLGAGWFFGTGLLGLIRLARNGST